MRLSRIALFFLPLLAGCGASELRPEADRASTSLQVEVPKGWSATRQPLTNVTDPRQLMAAASFPLRQDGKILNSPGCSPTAALDEARSRRGALVVISEYGPDHLNRRALQSLPRTPSALSLNRERFGRYECFGDGYDFQCRQRGRALIVHVAADPKTVHSAARRKAQRLIGSIELR